MQGWKIMSSANIPFTSAEASLARSCQAASENFHKLHNLLLGILRNNIFATISDIQLLLEIENVTL